MLSYNTSRKINRRFCVAPMMSYTHRHARYLFRLLSKRTMLYSEMITTGALLNKQQYLNYDQQEHPLALQLGGSDPEALSRCAQIAEDWGYDEINLNVGCPSNRVQSGTFGACLMAQPALVQEMVGIMKQKVSIPVTVKCRIGIDDQDVDQDLYTFVKALTQVSVDALLVHARKAWLHGINPKANRTLPPLNYQRVYQLKNEFPDLSIIMNGGIHSLNEAQQHLQRLDGVMLGRQIISSPRLLSEVDELLFNDRDSSVNIKNCLEQYLVYAENQFKQGASTTKVLQPVLGLFKAMPKAKYLRNLLCRPHKTTEDAVLALTVAIEQGY